MSDESKRYHLFAGITNNVGFRSYLSSISCSHGLTPIVECYTLAAQIRRSHQVIPRKVDCKSRFQLRLVSTYKKTHSYGAHTTCADLLTVFVSHHRLARFHIDHAYLLVMQRADSLKTASRYSGHHAGKKIANLSAVARKRTCRYHILQRGRLR